MNSAPRPLARRRRDLILELVASHGSVRVSELTDRLGVSDMTVRRDLDALASEGALRKVHGGATLPAGASATVGEPGFTAKLSEQAAEKAAIAAAAAAMIRPGTAIGLTAGTTTWELAKTLGGIADLVVVTNSIPILQTISGFERSDHSVMLTGGVSTPSQALVGPLAERSLRGLHLDQVFLGVHGMTERAGFNTPNLLEAETNRVFVAAGERLVVVADHTKWGTVGLASIIGLDAADALVTDDGLDAAAAAILEGHGVEVVRATPTRTTGSERR